MPIVVAIPPSSVASPIGMRMADAGLFARSDTLTRIGSSRTTIGVLFTNALNTAPTISVNSSESHGLTVHTRASARPTGSSAPVRTSPCPAIISAATATSASWPKP